MIERTVTEYECSICGTRYNSAEQCLACEEKPRSMDKGVKVGDTVKITRGQSAGKFAKVTKVFVYDRDWGHYAWTRYWHTVGLCAEIIGKVYSRQLTFDDYEVCDT